MKTATPVQRIYADNLKQGLQADGAGPKVAVIATREGFDGPNLIIHRVINASRTEMFRITRAGTVSEH